MADEKIDAALLALEAAMELKVMQNLGECTVRDTPLEFQLYHMRPLLGVTNDIEFALRVVVRGMRMEVRHTFVGRVDEDKDARQNRAIEELTTALSDKLANTIVRAGLSMAMASVADRLRI